MTSKITPAATIRDVAARAGVSTATVSNVFNRPDRVAAATRAKVMDAVAETGYVPNAAASRLRLLDNRAMGILVIDVGNAFHAALAKGAQAVAEEHGFTAILCDADRRPERMTRLVDFLESQRVAGILATGSTLAGVEERLDALRRRGVTVVQVDARATSPDRCSVAVDDIRGGEMVGRHLESLGRRTITYAQTEIDFEPFERRGLGLRSACRDAKVSTIRVPVEQYEDGSPVVEHALAEGSDAIFCANDHMAFGVLRELRRRGIRVPNDIAVVGYDDTELASMAAVPLTSVRQPADLVGRTAATLLLEECSGTTHDHRQVLYEPKLIVRESSTGIGDDD